MTPNRRLAEGLARAAVVTAVLTLALATPIVPGFETTALAKGGGGGGGGGNGGPPGQAGNSPGNSGNGRSDGATSPGRGDKTDKADKTDRPGKAEADGKAGRSDRDVAKDKARAGASLGALNAAHASPTARANAAPNSRVGQIAAYEKAMQAALAIEDPAKRAGAIRDARAVLDDAANKPVTREVVERVDTLLGLDTTPAAPAR